MNTPTLALLVVALDIQEGMLARTRARALEAGLANIEFLRSGQGEDRLERGRFDRAVLVTVLGEIPDQPRAMQELFDALRPGGLLSVTEVVFDPHFQTRQTVTRLAEAAGFREQAFFGNRIAYVIHFGKPATGQAASSAASGAGAWVC
jgi:ubiquinone/menaquinone biosynthesis C-methylase UbiE